MSIAVLWNVTLCSLTEKYQRFKGICLPPALVSIKILVTFYQTIWCYMPEDTVILVFSDPALNLLTVWRIYLHVGPDRFLRQGRSCHAEFWMGFSSSKIIAFSKISILWHVYIHAGYYFWQNHKFSHKFCYTHMLKIFICCSHYQSCWSSLMVISSYLCLKITLFWDTPPCTFDISLSTFMRRQVLLKNW